MKTKIIAYYLSQYHQIPENDEWWGEGFTEWTNTKKAQALYKGHYQPKAPLHNNYYDLSDIDVMKKQAKLAKNNGIYGFCFYHYWFAGKLLLEKPIESFLMHTEIDMPFCFMWANETWARTWDGKEGASEPLMKQDYGEEDEWKAHFEYLLPFFKDKRYICKDGKPILQIYKAQDIPRCAAMIRYWKELAVKNGLKGLYIIQSDNGKGRLYISEFDAVSFFELRRTVNSEFSYRDTSWHDNKLLSTFKYNKYLARKYYQTLDYDELYNKLINNASKHIKSNELYGAFVNWDNTARKGENGEFVYNFSVEKFKKYFDRLYKISNKYNKEFLFMFAWNEWAEGAYLEPDDKYGYACLHAVRDVVWRC